MCFVKHNSFVNSNIVVFYSLDENLAYLALLRVRLCFLDQWSFKLYLSKHDQTESKLRLNLKNQKALHFRWDAGWWNVRAWQKSLTAPPRKVSFGPQESLTLIQLVKVSIELTWLFSYYVLMLNFFRWKVKWRTSYRSCQIVWVFLQLQQS